MSQYRKMIGERIYLSPMSIEDAPQYVAWLNDPEVTCYLDISAQVLSESGEVEWIKANADKHIYSIILSEEDRLIGNVGFVDIDKLNATAEIGIFIGLKDLWGKGYGSEAMALLLGYGFAMLNLEAIKLRVYPWNPRASATYSKLGFKPAGLFRKALRRYGKSWDEPLMDITAEDFMAGPWARFSPAVPEPPGK